MIELRTIVLRAAEDIRKNLNSSRIAKSLNLEVKRIAIPCLTIECNKILRRCLALNTATVFCDSTQEKYVINGKCFSESFSNIILLNFFCNDFRKLSF